MHFAGRRVYLTGATGFIGGAIADRLLAAEADVTCLVRPGTPATRLEARGATIQRGDITDPRTLDLTDQGIVIHAAAWVGFGIPSHKRALFRQTNVDGTRHVVEAARKADVPRFVHISSIAALGATGDEPATEDTPRSLSYQSDYERTKTEAHEAAAHFPGAAIPMPGIVLGPHGPFEPLFRALAEGRIPALLSGDASKGWVHVDDVADAVLTASLRGRGDYLLVDQNLRLTELMIAALEEAGLPVPRLRVPAGLLSAAGHVVEGAYKMVRRTPPVSGELLASLRAPMRYDSSRARNILEWRPQLVRKLANDLLAMKHGY